MTAIATIRMHWRRFGRALVQRSFPTLDAAIIALDPFHRRPLP